jgi:hypothetical protein
MASRAIHRGAVQAHKSYAKRISGHIAYALVLYTLLLIFMVAPALKTEGTAIWPYLLLVVLVGAVIMPCRNLERRWQNVIGDQSERPFFRAVAALWLFAVLLPALLMVAIRALS